MINEKSRLLLLALISAVASLIVASCIIGLNYRSATENTYLRLQEVVQSQARLIESIVFDEAADHPAEIAVADALVVIKRAHMTYQGFGKTGEFALASLEGNQIRFQVQQRVRLEEPATLTAVDVEWAEPMRRALRGESGVILARDYRGQWVFAAYEPVVATKLGLVAKIDRAEIIGRFTPAFITAMAVALFVALVSVYLSVKLANPVILRLKTHHKELESAVERQRLITSKLRRRENQQMAIAELGLAILQGLGNDELLTKCVSVAAELLNVDYASILELRLDKKDLLLIAGVGWQDASVGKLTVPAIGGSQAAFTLRTKVPVIVKDLLEERRFSGPQLLIDQGVRSGMSVIIGSSENPWGVFGVHAKSRRQFSKADIFFIQSLANLLNNAILRSANDAELRKWNLLFKHAGWGMVVTDSATDRVIGVNPAFAKMHGYTEQEALNTRSADYLESGQEVAHANSANGIDRETRRTYESMHVRKDGSVFPVVVNVTAVDDDQGEEIYRVANIQDNTEQKRAVSERLAVEKQMQHAQKLESLGVLAGGIAHDFNNILMTIMGNASIALQDLSPHAPARNSVEAIESATQHAAALVKQMLAYSGQGQFIVENLDVSGLVEELAELLSASVEKNVILHYGLSLNLPSISADAAQISQILMNLVINASEAIGEKDGIIQVSTGVMECDSEYLESVALQSHGINAGDPLVAGRYVYLQVRDDGSGMDAETVAKIFDPFFTTKFTGRGLGLAALLGIVRAHRGTININSEVGKGSSFKVLLPVTTDLAATQVWVAPESETQNTWRGSGLVLLVDDDDAIVSLGERMLQRLGFKVITASDGGEAVSLYGEYKEDTVCVLLDLTMPRVSGAEAFRQIVQINPHAKIIICSGYNEEQVTGELAGQGLAGFLNKPYTMKDLKSKLRQVLA